MSSSRRSSELRRPRLGAGGPLSLVPCHISRFEMRLPSGSGECISAAVYLRHALQPPKPRGKIARRQRQYEKKQQEDRAAASAAAAAGPGMFDFGIVKVSAALHERGPFCSFKAVEQIVLC